MSLPDQKKVSRKDLVTHAIHVIGSMGGLQVPMFQRRRRLVLKTLSFFITQNGTNGRKYVQHVSKPVIRVSVTSVVGLPAYG